MENRLYSVSSKEDIYLYAAAKEKENSLIDKLKDEAPAGAIIGGSIYANLKVLGEHGNNLLNLVANPSVWLAYHTYRAVTFFTLMYGANKLSNRFKSIEDAVEKEDITMLDKFKGKVKKANRYLYDLAVKNVGFIGVVGAALLDIPLTIKGINGELSSITNTDNPLMNTFLATQHTLMLLSYYFLAKKNKKEEKTLRQRVSTNKAFIGLAAAQILSYGYYFKWDLFKMY